MKYISFIFILITVISLNAFSQQIYFCEGVTSDGYPENASDVFTIPRDGGYLYVLVNLPYEINCKNVSYDFFKVDYYGNKTYDFSSYQEVKNEWSWFWKQITFYEPGLYEVEVVDCYNYTVASARIRIQY